MIIGIAFNLVLIRARHETYREDDRTTRGDIRHETTVLQFADIMSRATETTPHGDGTINSQKPVCDNPSPRTLVLPEHTSTNGSAQLGDEVV